MTDTPTPPSAADIELIAAIKPRRQDQDPEAFTIYQVMLDQRAAQQIELSTYQQQGTMMWAGLSKPAPRGVYVDMSDDDLWAEAVATKVRRDAHLKSPEGNAARHLILAIRLATEIQQASFRMQDATSRSFANEASRIQKILGEALEAHNQLGAALLQVHASLNMLREADQG